MDFNKYYTSGVQVIMQQNREKRRNNAEMQYNTITLILRL